MDSPPVGSSFMVHEPSVDVDSEGYYEETELDNEVEDEVDELDSDPEPAGTATAPETISSAISHKRSASARTERVPGHTLLPAQRLEKIIQADGVTGHLALSKEGLFTLSIATEDFIKRFVQGGQRQASAQRRNIINYRDMADTSQQYQEFMFLKETIPEPLSIVDALQLRQEKEKQMFQEDPALSAFDEPTGPSSISAPAASSSSRSKSKGRMPNGKEKANGTSSSYTSSNSNLGTPWGYDNGRGHSVFDARPWTGWADSEAAPRAPSMFSLSPRTMRNGLHPVQPSNGHSPSRSETVTPAPPQAEPGDVDELMEAVLDDPPPSRSLHLSRATYPPQSDERSTGLPDGAPLHAPGPFSPENPGRTIYS